MRRADHSSRGVLPECGMPTEVYCEASIMRRPPSTGGSWSSGGCWSTGGVVPLGAVGPVGALCHWGLLVQWGRCATGGCWSTGGCGAMEKKTYFIFLQSPKSNLTNCRCM